MPASQRELLGALLKYPSHRAEDRLTELFATTLGAHTELLGRLFRRAGIPLPDDGVRFEVFTQRALTPRGRRPDMVVSAYEGQHLRAQLWSEHKTGSGFGDLQMEDYLAALEESRARHRAGSQTFDAALISIVHERSGEAEPEAWTALTWQEVAEMANAAGRQWNGPKWREVALAPDSPARERLLHEFIWYLKREGFAVVDALDADNLHALHKSAQTTDAIEALLERAALYMKEEFEPGELDAYSDGHLYYQLFKLPEDSWARRIRSAGWRADLELMVAGDDEWWVDSTGQPAFGAGFTLDEQMYEPLAAQETWLADLDKRELGFASYQGNTRVYRTMPMSDLITAGGTLDEQARVLADWALESFRRANAHDPGDEWEPPRRPSGRGRRSGDPWAADAHVTQAVSPTDIRRGRIRIPQGETKGKFFPAEADDVDIVLRGRDLTCAWDPRFGHGTDRGERSGVLRIDPPVLEEMVRPGEELRLSSGGAGHAIRLD